jgi:ferrous iron transport protein A
MVGATDGRGALKADPGGIERSRTALMVKFHALPIRLSAVRRGQCVTVVGIDETGANSPLPPGELERRLIEMGLVEGARVEAMHEAFPGRDPIAVQVNDHKLALRRTEAHAVMVTPLV